jgi:hypothetical protein
MLVVVGVKTQDFGWQVFTEKPRKSTTPEELIQCKQSRLIRQKVTVVKVGVLVLLASLCRLWPPSRIDSTSSLETL